MNGERDSWDDWMIVAGLVMFVVLSGGAAAAASAVLPQVRDWAVGAQVLVTGDAVLLPLAAGAGLDLPRVALLAALILFLVVAVVLAVRHRIRQGERRRR